MNFSQPIKILSMIFFCLFCLAGGFLAARFWLIEPSEETNEADRVEETAGSEASSVATDEKILKNNPYFHAIYFATSQDGASWNLIDTPVVEHASVPELIELDQALGAYTEGTLLSYFVDASELTRPGQEKIGLVASSDGGKTWSEKKTVNFSGLVEGVVPVDPSVFQLENGKLRLYFFDILSGKPSGDDQTTTTSSVFYSALSDDGENFVLEGEIFSVPSKVVTDPEVVFFNNQWLMYYAAEGFIGLATSSDGRNFKAAESLKITGIPGAAVVGNKIYLYACQHGRVSYAVSSDGKKFGSAKLASGFVSSKTDDDFCDGGPVVLSSGGLAMMIKTQPAPSADSQPPAMSEPKANLK